MKSSVTRGEFLGLMGASAAVMANAASPANATTERIVDKAYAYASMERQGEVRDAKAGPGATWTFRNAHWTHPPF